MLTCTPAVIFENIVVNMGLELCTTRGIMGVFICIAKRVNIVSKLHLVLPVQVQGKWLPRCWNWVLVRQGTTQLCSNDLNLIAIFLCDLFLKLFHVVSKTGYEGNVTPCAKQWILSTLMRETRQTTRWCKCTVQAPCESISRELKLPPTFS